MLVISYHTPKYAGVYEDYLGASLDDAYIRNIKHYEMPEAGNWCANTRYKPELIIKTLLEDFTGDSRVIYLDSDATVSIKLADIDRIVPDEYYAAGHFLNIGEWYGTGEKDKYGLLTGTLLFRKQALGLLNKWLAACKDSAEPDGPLLERLVMNDPRFYHLPLTYCYMASQPDGSENKVKVEKPVVTHHQISRKLKSGRTYKEYKEKAFSHV